MAYSRGQLTTVDSYDSGVLLMHAARLGSKCWARLCESKGSLLGEVKILS